MVAGKRAEHDLLRRVENIRTHKARGTRAPHKPLLLLWAIGRCLDGQARMTSYNQTAPAVEKLLKEFGPRSSSPHPEHPIWRLKNDEGLWESSGTEDIGVNNSGDPRVSMLKELNPKFGFPANVFDQLSGNPGLAMQLAALVLYRHFPNSLHDAILDAVGIGTTESTDPTADWVDKEDVSVFVQIWRRQRDPAFAGKVLGAYSNRCAICDYDVRLRDSKVQIGLEAAHIKWHCCDGPSEVANGLALCALHHVLFDRGAFTIFEDYRMHVSGEVEGIRLRQSLLDFDGRLIRLPGDDDHLPNIQYLRWHQNQVFRGKEI